VGNDAIDGAEHGTNVQSQKLVPLGRIAVGDLTGNVDSRVGKEDIEPSKLGNGLSDPLAT
jgi:hypothetical protein